MKTWVLILSLASTYSYSPAPTITSIPGYKKDLKKYGL